jgi:hypothetical protein
VREEAIGRLDRNDRDIERNPDRERAAEVAWLCVTVVRMAGAHCGDLAERLQNFQIRRSSKMSGISSEAPVAII